MPQKLLQKHSLERSLKLFNGYKRMTSPMGPFNDQKEKRLKKLHFLNFLNFFVEND